MSLVRISSVPPLDGVVWPNGADLCPDVLILRSSERGIRVATMLD